MATIELPVRSDVKAYNFTIELDSFLYTLRFRFNDRSGLWSMDIADSIDGDILNGVSLLTNIDLIDVNKTLLPPGRFILIDETGEDRNPGENDLGNDIKLLYQEAS